MNEKKRDEDYADWENEGGAIVVEFSEKALKKSGDQSDLETENQRLKDLEKFGDPPGGEA